jgi:hypothetical protein
MSPPGTRSKVKRVAQRVVHMLGEAVGITVAAIDGRDGSTIFVCCPVLLLPAIFGLMDAALQ